MHGGASTGPRTPEGLQRIVKARTVHGAYGAEIRSCSSAAMDCSCVAGG